MNAEFIEEVEKEILNAMDKGDIPGLSAVILHGDREVIKSYGYKDISKKAPVNSHTLFELGSCSKAFTALAVMYLANQHKINLDNNVSSYLPWFQVYFEDKREFITLRQLLHHTSGIPWNTISKIPRSEAEDALEQTVRQLIGQELDEIPGKEYEYATINYDVLALIIETVTNQSFESYLQENIINRLHLNSTSIGKPIDSSLMSTGYKISFFKPRVYEAPVFRGNYAAGYVISDAEDILMWLKFQLGLIDSELFDLAKLTHQRDESVPLHGMSSYAKGWEVTLDGTGEIYHGGLNPNFTSFIVFRPKEKMGVAILANSNSTFTPVVANKIMKLLAGEEIEIEFDPGDRNDKSYSVISFAISIYILVVIAFLVMIVIDVVKSRRKYEVLTISKIRKFARSLIIILPFLFGLYIFPQALADFTWDAVLIWTPVSFRVLMLVILLAIAISYFAYFLGLCFPEKNEYKRKAPLILLMSILSGLSNMAVIILVTSAINSDVALKYLIFYYTLVLGLYLLGRRFVQISLIKFTRGLIYDLRIQLIEKIFSTSYQKFEKIDRGRVYTSINDDINTIGQSTNLFVTLITSTITAVGAFIYLGSIAFWATMLTLFLIITLSAIYYVVSQSTNIYFEEARDEQNVFMRLLNGMIDGFKEISMRRSRKLEYKEDIANSADRHRKKVSTADIRFVNAFLVGESLLVVLLGVVSFGIREVFPNIEFYTVMSFVIVLLYLIGPINGILGAVPAIMRLKVSWNRVHEFIKDIPANLDLKKIPGPRFSEIKSIKAKGIGFQYENENEEEMFKVGPIDLEVHAGEVLFLIGGNGSGKTTLAKLLTGLYKPDEGQLMINNTEINGPQLSEYFSTVFSPPYLFDNLYGIDVNDRKEDVKKYLKLLDLQDKVQISENRYSTIDLSGGQRKRLALLQCYLEDLPIYLFDEWAADQDPEYRNFFYHILLPEMKRMGKVVIAITHDDHYFNVADKVLKMNQGKPEVYYSKDLSNASELN